MFCVGVPAWLAIHIGFPTLRSELDLTLHLLLLYIILNILGVTALKLSGEFIRIKLTWLNSLLPINLNFPNIDS